MTNDNDFYQELGRVPGLPPHLYGNIRRRIGRQALFMRAAYALAAALVLTVGTTGFWATHQGLGPATTAAVASSQVSPEVAEELQSVHDYCNGENLKQDVESYAYYDGDVAN